jgi:hypothetical protein
MTDQELRALVREVVQQRLVRGGAPASSEDSRSAPAWRQHCSHGLLPVPAGADTDGPCLIEPAVRCNHCGFCQSFGH